MGAFNFDPDKILFRCSALGQLMTQPRGKSPSERYAEAQEAHKANKRRYLLMKDKSGPGGSKLYASLVALEKELKELKMIKSDTHLSETCISHLVERVLYYKYGYEKDFRSKYVDKGLMVEEDTITLYSRVMKKMYRKNDKRLNNDFITGEPDSFDGETVETAKEIVDFKSSWDVFTFTKARLESVNKMYEWQGHGYLALTGAKVFRLVYGLINTPDVLVQDELRRLAFDMGVIDPEANDAFLEAQAKIERNANFDIMDMNVRIHETIIERDDNKIDQIYEQVKASRSYIKQHLMEI